MKRIMIMAVAALLGVAPVADDEYNYLTVTSTGSEQSISLPTVQKITFSGSNAVVTTIDGHTNTYPLDELQKLTFTAHPPAITALPTQEKNLVCKGKTLSVTGSGMLYIYNAAGVLVQMAQVKDGARISLESLPKGVYVASMGEQTIKIKK